MSDPRRERARARAVLASATAALLAIALGAAGCSLIPRLGGHASAEADTTVLTSGAADSAAAAGSVDSLEIGTIEADTVRRANAADSASLDDSSDDASEIDTRTTPPSTNTGSNGSGGNTAVSIDLGASERSRLASEAQRDLAEAEFVVRSVRRDHLDAAGLDRLSAVEGLIEQARTAYAREDIESAASFARKARLLALEVTERS